MSEPQRPPFYHVVPRQMWTALCAQCGADIFADRDYVAWSTADCIDDVIGGDGGYWRCACGAPLDQVEADALAEDPESPHYWTHRDAPPRPDAEGES